MTTCELLAPAGNMAALHAAISSGADAVYLGLGAFNARRGADNFTLETLQEACDYAHLRGVRIYLTMNTIVLSREFDDALEQARQAYRAGVDAFIVQDLGFASELRRTLPQAELHTSTQMNIHDRSGIRAAAKLGVARVTLARELSVKEIVALVEEAQRYSMEIEVFIHGALCVCYSGQCFMSSMIGGRSANRGMCAQACRLPYELYTSSSDEPVAHVGDYLLSPKDLCALDELAELVGAGVASFKIEGRMKSPEYVACAVSTYRTALDRIVKQTTGANSSVDPCDTKTTDQYRSQSLANSGQPLTNSSQPIANENAQVQPLSEQERNRMRDTLASTFSRGFTTAYLGGERGNDMMSYQRPNNRGQFVGRVSKDKTRNSKQRKGRPLPPASSLCIESELALNVGDIVEFWTRKGRVAETVIAVQPTEGKTVRLDFAGCVSGVSSGDRVFCVRRAQAAFEDNALNPRVPVVGHVALKIGEPLAISFRVATPDQVHACTALDAVQRACVGRLSSLCDLSTTQGVAQGSVVEAARTKAVTHTDIADHIDRLGNTPYVLIDLSIDLDEGVGIGFSQIHRTRAAALDALTEALLAPSAHTHLPKVVDRERPAPVHDHACEVAAWVTCPAAAQAAKEAGAHCIYVATLNAEEELAHTLGAHEGQPAHVAFPASTVVGMPPISHDAVGSSRETKIVFNPWATLRADDRVFVESLAGIEHARKAGHPFEIGPHVPLVNHAALDAAYAWGAARVWLSPELNLKQICELGTHTPVPLGLTVAGTQELMVTEHCLLMAQGPCNQQCTTCMRRKEPHYLKDRKGIHFPVATDMLGRSHLYNSIALDIVPAIPELIAGGVSSFMVDTTLMDADVVYDAVARVVRAVCAAAQGEALAKLEHTTSGHLYRGVS